MKGREVVALAVERDEQAGPEQQQVARAYRPFAAVEREDGSSLLNQYEREDVGKGWRDGVDVDQPVVHAETGDTVSVHLLYLMIFHQFA